MDKAPRLLIMTLISLIGAGIFTTSLLAIEILVWLAIMPAAAGVWGIKAICVITLLWLFISGQRFYTGIKHILSTVETSLNHIINGNRNDEVLKGMSARSQEQKELLALIAELMNHIDSTEKRLKEALGDAQQAAESKREFLAIMSHEIRTPLNGILGMSGLLKETTLEKEQRNYLDVIRDSSENLLMVINDILDFSKLEAGKMCIEMVEFDLTRLVESVNEILSPAAHGKGVEVSSYISPNVPLHLCGDVARIRQILNNLVSNAVKFTDEGAVMVEVFQESQGPKTVMLKFQVSDTGIGIASDQIEHLFDRFTQANTGISRKFGGTGLGLSICKQLVEMMGGEINVQSKLNVGSTFSFTVPLIIVAATDEETQKEDLHILQGKHILVVDDHNFNRHIFQKQLEKVGMSVETAPDGPSALVKLEGRLAERRPYDMVILDHLMPNMGGEDVLMHMKQNKDLAKTKVILASSQNISGGDPYFKQIGFDAVVIKPVREHTLFRWLKQVMADEEVTNEIEVELPPALRILVVEDNHVNQLFIQGALKKQCSIVDIAGNGVEALHVVQRMMYDVILMDINMPEMDGLTATQKIRQLHAPHGEIPIIAVTADVTAETLQKCYEAGMQNVLHKPAEPQAIYQAIKDVLAESSPQGQDVAVMPLGRGNGKYIA